MDLILMVSDPFNQLSHSRSRSLQSIPPQWL